ncbi:MAG: efflux RND transporter periplasmic adaptor subunit, partial [Planctomycetaceae bacterium]
MRCSPSTFGLILIIYLAGCGKPSSKSPKKTAPAKVAKHPSEDNIALLTLTPKAVERLGITTAETQYRRIRRYRTLAGDVVVPVGKTLVVTAPLSGTVRLPKDAKTPVPGESVAAGNAVLELVPLLPPERKVPNLVELVQMANAKASLVSAQIVADGDVKQTKAEVKAAKIQRDIAERLYNDMTGTQRAFKEAVAQLNVAEKKHEAALARQLALQKLSLDLKQPDGKTERKNTVLSITAPDSGLLRNLTASPGQIVNAGAPLFEVIDLKTVWIRVPIYVEQLKDFDLKADARVGSLNGRPRSTPRIAKYVTAPPTADAPSNAVHAYYQVPNPDAELRPGHRVGVTIPLQAEDESLVVPWASVVFDYNGIAWVYERVKPTVFRRQKVFVRYSHDKWAVLASGPPKGMKV